jgi:hypothetical protein
MKHLANQNFNQNEIQNAVVQVLAAAPSSPKEAQIYYDSNTGVKTIKFWNGTAWQVMDPTKATGIPLSALATDPLARANHTGTQLAATISDLATTVKAYKVSDFAAATASVSMGGNTITNVATPVNSTDAANKQYVDDSVAGLSWKDEVAAATTANIALSGAQTIDGVAVVANDRVLVKDQTTQSQNGIYIVAAGAWSRAGDANTGNEMSGAAVFVRAGTTNGGARYVCSTQGAITLDTTSLNFVVFGAGSSYTNGNGISLTGNSFSVNPAASGGISVSAGGVALDTTIAVRKYAVTIGDGSATSIAVTHNLNTQDATVQVREVSTNALVNCDIVMTSANVATVSFSAAPTASSLRVVVHG